MAYVLSVSALLHVLRDMESDGLTELRVSYIDGDDELPPCFSLSASSPGLDHWVDYEEVEVRPDE